MLNYIQKIVSRITDDTEIISDKVIYDGGMVPHQGLFIKRDLLQECPFDLQYKIAAADDNLLKLLLGRNAKFKGVFWAVGSIFTH